MTVQYVVTGFSTFPNVPSNPTEVLVMRLKTLLESGLVCLEGEIAAGFDAWISKAALKACIAGPSSLARDCKPVRDLAYHSLVGRLSDCAIQHMSAPGFTAAFFAGHQLSPFGHMFRMISNVTVPVLQALRRSSAWMCSEFLANMSATGARSFAPSLRANLPIKWCWYASRYASQRPGK